MMKFSLAFWKSPYGPKEAQKTITYNHCKITPKRDVVSEYFPLVRFELYFSVLYSLVSWTTTFPAGPLPGGKYKEKNGRSGRG